MLREMLISFVFGVAVYVVTALLLGRERTNSLPGGAIGAFMFVQPWYIGILFGLLGHVVSVKVANRFSLFNRNQPGRGR